MSDSFKSYCRIPEIPERNYVHKFVNHEIEFVDSEGNHTNNIEATWRVLKSGIPTRCRNINVLQSYLFEGMWRAQNVGCVWEAMIFAIKETKYARE